MRYAPRGGRFAELRSLWYGRTARTLAMCLAAVGLSGNGGCFYYQAAAGQLFLINHQIPLQTAIAATEDDDQRRMLAWVPEILSFARDVMAMDAGQSYRGFVDLGGRGPTQVLSAAKRTQLTAYRWWFPLAGAVEYKSFFSEDDARREAKALQNAGYDTYLAPSRAYSTLGYLRDPVTSAMMESGFTSFVEVLLHELAHRRFYVAGETEFNERLASFVGKEGTRKFLSLPRFAGSGWLEIKEARWALEGRFQREVVLVADSLGKLYASALSDREKLARREQLFARVEQARPPPNNGKTPARVNNAFLLQYLRYSQDSPELQQMLYRTCHGNWRCFWHAVEQHAG